MKHILMIVMIAAPSWCMYGSHNGSDEKKSHDESALLVLPRCTDSALIEFRLDAADLPIKNPALASTCARETWCVLIAALRERSIALEKRAHKASKSEQECPLKRALGGDEDGEQEVSEIPSELDMIKNYEQHCGYFALSDAYLKHLSWKEEPKLLNDFVAGVVLAIKNAVMRNKTKKTVVVSLGSYGRFMDFAILESVLFAHRDASLEYWFDSSDRVPFKQVDVITEESQAYIESQFSRYFTTRYATNKSLRLLQLPKASKHSDAFPVPDVLCARDALTTSGKSIILKDYKAFCHKALDNDTVWAAFMLRAYEAENGTQKGKLYQQRTDDISG